MIFFDNSKIMMPYVIRDENMKIIGIHDTAPEEAKKAFEEYLKLSNQAEKEGYRL